MWDFLTLEVHKKILTTLIFVFKNIMFTLKYTEGEKMLLYFFPRQFPRDNEIHFLMIMISHDHEKTN